VRAEAESRSRSRSRGKAQSELERVQRSSDSFPIVTNESDHGGKEDLSHYNTFSNDVAEERKTRGLLKALVVDLRDTKAASVRERRR
jgi:hypothetical protein